MIREEGLENVFRRHERHARAVRAAVWEWGLEIVCTTPQEYSNTVTAVFTPGVMMRINCVQRSLNISTCRLAPVWESLRAKCFASATWDISMI